MSAGDGLPPESPDDNEENGLLYRFRHDESGPLMFVRELLTSMATVAAVGLLLFGLSGVWPPMVAVESGSMEPSMQRGDLIFVTEPGRFAPDAARGDTGVVTYEVGEEVGYSTFNGYGSVVIYERGSGYGTPVIHRARFWVEEGENWYDEANKDWIRGADNCEELQYCPAPHSGFITKGDNNGYYDQVRDIRAPVKPEWLIGTARLRIPYLGHVRLGVSGATIAGPVDGGVVSATTESTPTANATVSAANETSVSVGVGSTGPAVAPATAA